MIDVIVVRSFGQFTQRTTLEKRTPMEALPPIGSIIRLGACRIEVREIIVDPPATFMLLSGWEPEISTKSLEAAQADGWTKSPGNV